MLILLWAHTRSSLTWSIFLCVVFFPYSLHSCSLRVCSSRPNWIILSVAAWFPPQSCLWGQPSSKTRAREITAGQHSLLPPAPLQTGESQHPAIPQLPNSEQGEGQPDAPHSRENGQDLLIWLLIWRTVSQSGLLIWEAKLSDSRGCLRGMVQTQYSKGCLYLATTYTGFNRKLLEASLLIQSQEFGMLFAVLSPIPCQRHTKDNLKHWSLLHAAQLLHGPWQCQNWASPYDVAWSGWIPTVQSTTVLPSFHSLLPLAEVAKRKTNVFLLCQHPGNRKTPHYPNSFDQIVVMVRTVLSWIWTKLFSLVSPLYCPLLPCSSSSSRTHVV